MKVLLLAPQPFYQERGTPIAVDLLLRALAARGETVDVLVYHEGAHVSYPGARVHRIPRVPFVRNVGPGPSLKKLVCDAVFVVKALGMAARGRYALVHAVEESVFVALLIKRLFRIPYVYDMDSWMGEQVIKKYPVLSMLGPWLRWSERLAVRSAEVVVPVCDALADLARAHRPRRVVVLRDVSLLSLDSQPAPQAGRAAREFIADGPIVMYVGNLEPYQGVDLLLRSFALATSRVPSARLVVIGGQPAHIAQYQQMAGRVGLGDAVRFLGPRPLARLGEYLASATVLVSPRLQGGNTPMKLYSYLHSGKAVLATDLPTHTQVLSPDVALLKAPTPEAFAEGLVALLTDERLRQRLGEAGQRLVAERHSYEVFQATLNEIYDDLSGVRRRAEGDAPSDMVSDTIRGGA